MCCVLGRLGGSQHDCRIDDLSQRRRCKVH
jgi:hypothetical protein